MKGVPKDGATFCSKTVPIPGAACRQHTGLPIDPVEHKRMKEVHFREVTVAEKHGLSLPTPITKKNTKKTKNAKKPKKPQRKTNKRGN